MHADVKFAHALADAADAVTLARFGALDLRVETKPDLSPVSEADRDAEEAIRSLVAASGRGEGVLGEEFGDDGGDAKWIVDPIDGTTSYYAESRCGRRCWRSNATGRSRRRSFRAGTGAALVGATGRGCLRGRRRLSRLVASGGWRTRSCSCTSQRRCRRAGTTIVDRAWSNRGFGDFWQYCLVAEGVMEVGSDSVVHVWDYAAVQVLVEEAGGGARRSRAASRRTERASSRRTASARRGRGAARCGAA